MLSLLERSPSSLTYWLPLNMGVSGVRLLELQRWLLGEQGVCVGVCVSMAHVEQCPTWACRGCGY